MKCTKGDVLAGETVKIDNGAVTVDDNEGRMDWGEWKLPDCNGKIGSVEGEREGPCDT